MEPGTEPRQDPPANPGSRSRLLFAALGVTLLTISLYLLLGDLADRLPVTYGDTFLKWAGPLEGLPPESIWAVQSVILRILACAFGLLLLYGCAKLFSGQKLRLPFARITKQHRASLAKNVTIYFFILIAQTILFSLLNLGRFVEEPAIRTLPLGLWGSFLVFFFIVVAAPFFEEILFRGFLFRRLRSAFRFWPAFLISGLFFSLLHFSPQGSIAYNTFNIADSFVFSYFVTKTFEETGNLWNPFIAHAIYNGWVAILLYLTSLLESLSAFSLYAY